MCGSFEQTVLKVFRLNENATYGTVHVCLQVVPCNIPMLACLIQHMAATFFTSTVCVPTRARMSLKILQTVSVL